MWMEVAVVAIIFAVGNILWAMLFLGLLGLFAIVVHAWWLPRLGINGWTGEPKEKYPPT